MSMPSTQRSRFLLTLNAACIPRATICRLAREVERLHDWAGAETLADPCEVPLNQLRLAIEALRTADSVGAREEELAIHNGAQVVCIGDDGYPPALLDQPLPPPVLFVRGALDENPSVALVGSRRMDAYGEEVARLFSRDLVRAGVTVVSGFAQGVDATVHRAALEAGGRTVAVLGCGLSVDYPRGQRALAREISASGAVVSEFPCTQTPEQRNFPIRNRIIAALAQVTVVIQAAVRSGSLVTARLALELGRDVCAVPGRIFDEKAQGTNGLLRDGAHLVQHPEDVLDLLGLAGGVAQRRKTGAGVPAGLDPRASSILEILVPGDPISTDRLCEVLREPAEVLLPVLLDLELSGLVRRYPGQLFSRVVA
jgi:DNA processing protein